MTFPPKPKEHNRMFTPHQVHMFFVFFYKVVKLVCGGSVINMAYPV